ncbi:MULTISPECIES: hypothetical protein [Oxalobacteraceae]|uniref:DUF2845 domain-containing protein n=1 Tax=Herminiimonas aquatilis TaxID=345342 RepID=A0ABW2J986_9BURK|nr:hypothetical protein [Janthinobacterium sp. Marseille]
MEYIVIFGLIVAASLWYSSHKKKVRRQRLMTKYGDADLVDRIMDGLFWQGQTDEQLLDSIGQPLDVDSKVMRAFTRKIWKYQQTGKGRYALRITLENDIVVGWDKKSS